MLQRFFEDRKAFVRRRLRWRDRTLAWGEKNSKDARGVIVNVLIVFCLGQLQEDAGGISKQLTPHGDSLKGPHNILAPRREGQKLIFAPSPHCILQ